MRPVVLVILGTDHHRFDRLVDWADHWQTKRPDVRVVVQHGFSAPPRVAETSAFFPAVELQKLAASADTVVCHGGPGTIADASVGPHLPVVVARDPRRGEHVDDHQQRYARWAEQKGLVRAVSEVAALDAVVESDLTSTVQVPPRAVRAAASVRRVTEVIVTSASRHGLPVAPDAPTAVHVSGPDPYSATLFERRLNELPGVVGLGDVAALWSGILRDDAVCSCGETFSECWFWTTVGQRAFGGWQQVDPERVRDLRDQVGRSRHMGRTAMRHTSSGFRRALLDYTGHFRQVYSAALEVAEAEIVVDSSREPSTALALSHDRGIDLRTVQIVPRALRDTKGTTRPLSRAAASGVVRGIEREGLAHRGVPLGTVRYEDLETDARREVRRVLRELDLPVGDRQGGSDRLGVPLHRRTRHSLQVSRTRERGRHPLVG